MPVGGASLSHTEILFGLTASETAQAGLGSHPLLKSTAHLDLVLEPENGATGQNGLQVFLACSKRTSGAVLPDSVKHACLLLLSILLT